MTISSRQAELFAGESWQSIYQAFARINFNATDPVSINRALQDYIRINYPEEFNDWIVSSEFVAIIDLLSWLAGTLAFKTDLAARENFIDTAESRESILRLARFLSYNPNRCQPATGVLKVVDVISDDDVFDSFGANLSNTAITWNDPNNPNWFEQFTAVLNAALIPTNPFGIPLKDGTVAGISTQLYRMNNRASDSLYSFFAQASGQSMDFELCNGDFSDGGVLFERAPNPSRNAFHFYYLNDGNGNNSTRTGFFLLFKQGTTYNHTFPITVPIENQLLNLDADNVTENDVWVQTIDDNGVVLFDWIKVPALINANITFNDVPNAQRNIFSVLTRDNDQISVRFSDGRFGNAPIGNINVTYRVASGASYQIKPLEISNVTLPITYVTQFGTTKTLSLTFSLFENIANAAIAETVEQIRQRAPQVYATQNRMVSGEDYNIFPLSTNLAAKIKAVNRVYSGQSRYIDLHDPTGTYQDLSLFADDGILFASLRGTYLEIPTLLNKTSADMLESYILPTLDQYTVNSLISDVLMQNVLNGTIVSNTNIWTTSNADLFQTTGWFNHIDPLLQPGAIVQFSINGIPTWVAVNNIEGSVTTVPALNTAGPVTLSREVPTGSSVLAILPSTSVGPSVGVHQAIVDKLDHRLSFSLWYDYSDGQALTGPVWQVGDALSDFGNPSPILVNTRLLIMMVNYRQTYVGQTATIGLWQITARGLGYVFESIKDIQWYDNGNRGLAQMTGESARDLIRILRVNRDLNNPAGFALPTDFNLVIDRLWLYPDGTAEPRRTTITLYDSDQDGYPDQPDTFYRLIAHGIPYAAIADSQQGQSVLMIGDTSNIRLGQTVSGPGIVAGTIVTSKTDAVLSISNPLSQIILRGTKIILGDMINSYLFWSNAIDPPYDHPIYTVFGYDSETLRAADHPAIGTVGFQVNAASLVDVESFWVYTSTGWQPDATSTYRYGRGRGPNVASRWSTAFGQVTPDGDAFNFHWKHYAPTNHRLDPSPTNIHDIFVLTFAYDTQVRQWIINGATPRDMPQPPTELDLRLAFVGIEQNKMFSDQLVWRPVRYKFLFGATADIELQAQFKVVRLPNAAISDGEIKSQIITAINTYFAVANWDFGETFFFTELAAYIHQQLAGLIGSVVLVPLATDAAFGDGFEVACRSDEIFISTAQVSDIVLIPSNTAVNLRIGTRTVSGNTSSTTSTAPTAPSPTTSFFEIARSVIGGPDRIVD